jgi:hypothetical protein
MTSKWRRPLESWVAISESLVVGRRRDWLANWAGLAVAGVLFAASGLLCVALGVDQARVFYAEEGPIEESQAILLVTVAILYVAWKARLGLRSYAPSLILLLMAARELDADKWFTAKSVMSTGFYFENPGVSYGVRLFFGVVVAALGVVILRFLWNARYDVLRALGAWRPYCRSMIVAFAMLGASFVFDGFRGKLYALTGIHASEWVGYLTGIGEETAEAAMVLAFLAALLQLRFDPARNALPSIPGAGKRSA